MKTFLLLGCSVFAATMLFAQQRTVTGKVTDGTDGSPLPGVSVLVKGTAQGTVTDADGLFSLQAPSEATLTFSFIGYEPQDIPVGDRTSIDINMKSSISQLQEVVVIGYGERDRKDVTGAISTVNAKDIVKTPAMNPEMTMQGRMAGVFVATPGGSPFQRPTVRIRGVSTWGYADPLYVIDGIPIIEGLASSTWPGYQDSRSPVSIMSSLNPNDIESISVLKDASAGAIYGVRASNGVILITTKKGKAGKPRVEVSAQKGVQNVVNTFDMLNTQQYTTLYQQAYANNPSEAANLPAEFKPSDPKYLGNSPTYDWQDRLINSNATVEDYSIRVSGGSETTNYYISAGYGKTEASLVQNQMDRFSLASNVTTKISKWLEAGMNLKLSDNRALDNTNTDGLSYVATAPPWQPIDDPNNVYGYAPSVTIKYKDNPQYNPDMLNPGPKKEFDGDPAFLWGPATRGNVFATQSLNERSFNLFRTIGNVYLQIEPVKGLKIRGALSGDFYINQRKEWQNYDSYVFSQTPGNRYSNNDGTSVGSYGERQLRNYMLMKELTLNYNRTFGKHNLDVVVSGSQQDQSISITDASSGQVNSADPDQRFVMNRPPFNGTFTTRLPQVLVGFMGRASYKFNDKYYLDATVRRDGTSLFAPDYRWGTFVSFAGGWRISSEQFFQALGASFISDLKLRGGWGELGNKETAEEGYAYLSKISNTPDYPFGSGAGNGFGTQTAGASLPNFPNFELTWERVRTTNIGFDAELFNSHITFTAEYYNRYTKGVIQDVNLPPNAGVEVPIKLNIGDVRNQGIELQLGYNNVFGEVQFNASANFTTTKNRVVRMYQGTPMTVVDDPNRRIEEGYPIGYLWGYEVGGIFQNDQEIADYKAVYSDGVGTNNPAPGDMWFKDVNGSPGQGEIRNPIPDSAVNNNDRTYLGKIIPGYYYGFNLGASFKGFDISLFFQGVGDVQKYNDSRSGGEAMSSTGANQWTSTLGRWTVENPSTSMPRAVRNDPNANTRYSSRFVEGASFMRLKNAQIGYSLPASLLGKTNAIERVRIYVSATNLFTWTKWSGPDPENDIYPPSRQITVGLNASF